MRNLGGSIGIAFVTTMLARGAQTHQALMVGHLTATDPAVKEQFCQSRKSVLLGQQTDPVTATRQAYNAVYSLLDQQAHLWAFVDNFYMFGLLALAGIPLVFLFQTDCNRQKTGGCRTIKISRIVRENSRNWPDLISIRPSKYSLALAMLKK